MSTRLVIPEKDDPEEMALMLNGRKRKFTLENFMNFGASLGLNEKQIENALGKYRKNIHHALEFVDIGFLSESKTEEYKELISNRAKRLKLITNE